jgi:cytochrome c6
MMIALSAALSFGQDKDGSAIFGEKCAGCHGTDGKAQTETGMKLKAADLTSAKVQGKTDADLSAIVTNGKGKMPAFKGKLSDAEIQAVVANIRSLAK